MQDSISIMDLVKYDPQKGMFVLKQQEQQIEYWPGTGVQKSKHNVFNWKGSPSILRPKHMPPVPKPKASPTMKARSFIVYSKAQQAK